MGPWPQSAEVRGVERLAVALRPARVGVPDADPGPGQALELPGRRPAVERVRAAVDLEDERGRRRGAGGRARAGSAAGTCQPWTRRPSTVVQRVSGSTRAIPASASRLSSVSRRSASGRRDPPRRARRARWTSGSSVGDERRTAIRVEPGRPARDRVPARQVVVALGQPLERAVGDGDPPELVGALDRRAEQDRPAVARSRPGAAPRRS